MNLSNLVPTIATTCQLGEMDPRAGEPLILGVPDPAKPAIIAGIARGANRTVLVIMARQAEALTLVWWKSWALGWEKSRLCTISRSATPCPTNGSHRNRRR